MSNSKPLVLAVVGPTAVGKTEIAIQLAERLKGEIVSIDSRQMYRELNIGTAKPSAEELERAPHHLVDCFDPRQAISLPTFLDLLVTTLDSILEAGKLPILAGGTGQYFRALIEGWQVPRVAPIPELRDRLLSEEEEFGTGHLHAKMAAIDPESAARIDPRNTRRIIRALEVHHASGETFSSLRARSEPRYDFLIIGLDRPREALYQRVDSRIDRMMEAGLEKEVRVLLDRGIDFDLPAMSSLGYREWRAHIDGQSTREEVVAEIRRNTRRLVRSQGAWFRKDDPRLHWFDLSQVAIDDILEQVDQLIAKQERSSDT